MRKLQGIDSSAQANDPQLLAEAASSLLDLAWQPPDLEVRTPRHIKTHSFVSSRLVSLKSQKGFLRFPHRVWAKSRFGWMDGNTPRRHDLMLPTRNQDVKALHKESQYGAWVLVHGYNVNHFTSLINSHNVQDLSDIEKTSKALEKLGRLLTPGHLATALKLLQRCTLDPACAFPPQIFAFMKQALALVTAPVTAPGPCLFRRADEGRDRGGIRF